MIFKAQDRYSADRFVHLVSKVSLTCTERHLIGSVNVEHCADWQADKAKQLRLCGHFEMLVYARVLCTLPSCPTEFALIYVRWHLKVKCTLEIAIRWVTGTADDSLFHGGNGQSNERRIVMQCARGSE